MQRLRQKSFTPVFAIALLLNANLAVPLATAALTDSPGASVTARKSADDLVLSFATTTTNFYGVRTCPDLSQPWTNVRSGIQGDGMVKSVTISNALRAARGFYQVLIQPRPLGLLLPQLEAFAILGHSCGGIQEQVHVTGFDPSSGYPIGEVYLKTTCSTGGRGTHPATFTAWASVMWDLGGKVVFSGALSNGMPVDPAFAATDAFGDIVYNSGTTAYLIAPLPAAPTGVNAFQSGDEFQVSWTPMGVNPAAIISSTLTATPINSTASTLTTTVVGPAANGVIASLQPHTTYGITVLNTTVGGPGPASTVISVTTEAASIPPSAPGGVTARWTNLDPTGANDTLVVAWQAAVPGNSPIDQYQVSITGSDGGGTFTQTVSGATLTLSFTVDYIPDWSVTVRAHNAVGWGQSSRPVVLGGL